MRQERLVPDTAEIALICLRPKDGAIQIGLVQHRAECTASYRCKLADLPGEGQPVRILLHARKFFCLEDRC